MAILRFRDRALDEIAVIFGRISKDNMEAAVEVDRAIGESCQLLSENPGVGPSCGFPEAALLDCRFWPVKKYKDYLVIYRPIPEGIEVLSVIHGSQDFNRLGSRLK
ncbi:MAG TPA: type II toxin-antitoxin system RelE/ParE family toxin [Tepidisphaeraceae bacterium]|jgi:plasmid stabilization system protein ParE|nr:type II toxin-antitoxin system RelE/ParE family toxin [Tepidisphaeraceae bacterium]